MAFRQKWRFFLLTCFVLTIVIIYLTHPIRRKSTRLPLLSEINTGSPSTTGTPNNTSTRDTPVTLFVRMAGKLEKYRMRYYCYLFRTTVLYWPPSFGKTTVLLDEESEQDHVFGEKIAQQNKKHFPDHKLEILYESLPKDETTLAGFPGNIRPRGYSRQLWSSFFIDLYTNDSIVGWMDTDAAFMTPVTKSMIFSSTKLRVLGSECSMSSLGDSWVKSWVHTTQLALGLPMVVDFMTYFPAYIYRDTFTHCRGYILKRFNTSDFDEAFRKFHTTYLCPVCIILSYAWYFERDRYDWNLKICSDLTKYNKRFPTGHAIGPEHMEAILSEPSAAYHVPYGKFLSSNVRISYCLSHRAVGNKLKLCANHSMSLTDNLVLLNHDLQRVKSLGRRGFAEKSLCTGNNTDFCLRVLERHYNQVALEIKQKGRKLEWRNVETVEKLANDVDIKCKPLS